MRPRRISLLALLVLAACSSDIGTPSEPLRILDPVLPDAVLNEIYNQTILATGGLRPYTFAVEEGVLPPGIELAGGTLRGTPSELGSFEFTIAVSDANLAKTFETYRLEVIELPPPVLGFEPPLTDVQTAVTLRGRLGDARQLRALRTVLSYDPERFTLGDQGVVAARGDVAVFWHGEAGSVAIDVAFLGPAFDGETELFRLDLVPVATTTLFVTSETEFLSAAGHHFARRQEGTRPAQPAADEGGAPEEGVPEEGLPPEEEEEE